MDITAWKHRLDTLLDAEESAMFTMLERLVGMDSFTSDAADVNRLGTAITDWLAAEAGMRTSQLAKRDVPEDEPWQHNLGDVFMARSHDPSVGPGIGIIGHMDTVFPAGTAQARPFRLDKAADRATGPGVADMKAGLVAGMFAARALRALDVDFPLTLMFSPDEELGSPTASRALADQLAGARAVICAEPGGVGGVVTLSRKGSGHMHLKVTGKAAHAGRCYADGVSAILELAHKTLAINEHLDLAQGITVNTGLISGGTSANSVAPCAESRIHLTYRTLDEGRKVVQAIRDITARSWIPGTTSHVSGGLRLYPLERTPQGDALFELVREAGQALGLSIAGQHYESAAESGFCSSVLGIPTICCMGPEGDNIHSVDEFMVPSTLLPRCKLIALSAIQATQALK